MSHFSANLNVMINAARKASRGLVRDFGEVEKLQVRSKSAGDFVSRADVRAEEQIREELTEARPNYGWLGEETGETKGEDPTRRWIVDPLDGTNNFLHGIPHWSISIGLEHKGEIVAGVIFDPIKQELFVAEKGAGAWMNDQRIRVSDRRVMIDGMFSTDMPFPGDIKTHIGQIARLSAETGGIRRLGSAALDLAYVAAGRLDGAWQPAIKPWDVAAGVVMLREAGGMIDTVVPDGNPVTDGSLIAANADIFGKFAKILRDG